MSKIESKIGVISERDEKIYQFLSDFNNFKSLLPPDKVKDFESDGESCRFTVEGIGQAGLKFKEKEPHNLIKIISDEQTPFDFTLWIQIKEVKEGDSRMKITIDANLNTMMAAMVKKPLKTFVDTLIEQAEKINYEEAG